MPPLESPAGVGFENLRAALANCPADPGDYERMADWLMGHGHAGQAARWRTWSLLPPAPELQRQALHELATRIAPSLAALESPLDMAQRLADDPSEPLPESERTLAAVQALLEAEQLGRAQALMARLALREGLPPSLCNRVAMLLEQRSEYWQAERWYRTSLQKEPGQALVWFPLARILIEQGAPQDALHAAEQGLLRAPGHPWGLKLRMRALIASGAWQTLELLEQAGALSPDPDLQGWLAVERKRCGLARRRCPQPARPLPVATLLDLRRRLATLPSPWLLVHGRAAAVLRWAAAQDVLPADLRIQPLASRDPVGVQQALAGLPCEALPELPTANLLDPATYGLLLLERSPLPAQLPRLLGLTLGQHLPIGAPLNLVAAHRQRELILTHAGWQLWWPLDADF